jgi:hypothetical protein
MVTTFSRRIRSVVSSMSVGRYRYGAMSSPSYDGVPDGKVMRF